MTAQARQRRSLLFLLVGIIVMIVVIVLGAHSAHHYYTQRDRMSKEMRQDAAESIARLTKTLAPLIEAYAVNEYDNLVATEIEMHQLYAVVVLDLNMGNVLGQDAYISGKIRDRDDHVVDLDYSDAEQRQQLASVFFTDVAPIHSATGELIGRVSVYITDVAMEQALARVFGESLMATSTMALLLITSLIFFIQRLFVRPLVQIANTFEQRDSDGIPTFPAPDFAYREISMLTSTMNGMLDVIRQSRDLLQQERRHLQSVIDGTNVGTWEWNVQTGETLFNARWAEIIGYSLEELAPISIDTWMRFAHPDDLKQSADLLSRHFAGDLPFYEIETRMRHKAGHWVWVLDRGKVATWTEDGKPLLMSGTHQDISQRKQAEADLLEAKHAAEAANVAKSRFLATMSHEIRTPMNGILGMAQLLLSSSMSEAERRDCARTILNSGQTLLTLLNDILDLSKVEAGKFTLEEGVIEPWQILHETHVLFFDSAMSKGLAMKFHWRGPDGQRYQGDPHRLRQMLANLVNNAIKFTSKGEIQIESREVAGPEDAVCLEFSVSDSGLGIGADKIDLLFKPFSQADNATSRQFGGSGLGLSIVRSLALLMGGDVGVESTPEHGSRFWFRIRTERVVGGAESRQAERKPNALSAQLRRQQVLSGHVLIVEDNPTNQLVINALLNKMGITTHVAENGQLAVDLITVQAASFDAILMDLEMPVLDGHEATRRIRDWESTNHRARLPIIALTANAFAEDRERSLRSGMDDFLAKPIIAEDLMAVLGKWLKPGRPSSTNSSATAPETKTSADRALNVPRFLELSEALIAMFKLGKFDAVHRFSELEALLQETSQADALIEVRRAVQEFQFEKAVVALSRIRDKL